MSYLNNPTNGFPGPNNFPMNDVANELNRLRMSLDANTLMLAALNNVINEEQKKEYINTALKLCGCIQLLEKTEKKG